MSGNRANISLQLTADNRDSGDNNAVGIKRQGL